MDDSRTFVTENYNELWLTRTCIGNPGAYKFIKINNNWSKPESIVSQFAGEPTLDREENLYFVYHFFGESINIIDANIYFSYKK